MKILILRSVKNTSYKDPYSVSMDVNYANRVVGHLTDKGNYCHACGEKCITCRKRYTLDFSESIVGIVGFPSVLPAIIEDAGEYLPEKIPAHDVLLAIGVNEEILFSFINKFSQSKAVIIPIERSDWLSPHAKERITEIGKEKEIEVSFPKPFCSFNPKEGILRLFREQFRIGKPEINFTIRDNIITGTDIISSAPCGATYFTARGLIYKNISDNLEFVIDNQLSSFPCTADTAVDREFKDSITHQAVKIQRDVLLGLKRS
jgi:hypothetical protein